MYLQRQHYIYSPNYYENGGYLGISELVDKLEVWNCESISKSKSIIWIPYSISCMSDISWESGCIRLRDFIEYSELFIHRLASGNRLTISTVAADFQYTQRELLRIWQTDGMVESGSQPMFVSLLAFKKFRVIGVFHKGANSRAVVSDATQNISFLVKYDGERKRPCNLISAVCLDESPKYMSIALPQPFENIKMQISHRQLCLCIKPYMPLLAYDIQHTRILPAQRWRSMTALKSAELYDDATYKDAEKS